MPKLCKRIIALLLAFCLVCSLCFSAFAVTSENQATFWEAWLAYLAGMNDNTGIFDGWGGNDFIGNLISPDTVCPESSDGYHHGSQVDGLVDGRAKVKCSECGQWFYYSASDLENQYTDAVHDSNLDNGFSVSPSGSLIVYPSWFGVKDGSQRIGFSSSSFDTGATVSSRTHSISNGVSRLLFQLESAIWLYQPGICYSFNLPSNCSFSFSAPPSSVSILFWENSDYSGSRAGSYSCNNSFFNGTSCRANDSLVATSSVELFFNYNTSNNKKCWSGDISCSPISISISDSSSLPTVPQSITINNNTYPVVDIDFNSRTVHVTDDRTIIYDDDHITIKESDTVIQTINYIFEDDDPGTDPGNGDDSSTPVDPGVVDPGDASGSGGSGCCEQCALLLRQVNSYLLQIQTLVDQINDKLGPESDNYMQGIYNLLVEINTALDNLPTEPHKDYEAKLTTISNQLANIWGDLDTIKTSLSAVQTNTATTNQKLDTVHADLQAVLAELQTQRGILSQILSVLRDMLGHITSIDSNVEELANEEDSQNFFDSFILKFHFIGDIFSIIRQLFADITNDAATVTFVDNGDLPIGDLTSQHFPVSGSPVPVGTAPEIMIRFPSDTYHGADLSGYSAIDMSWYAPYKSRVDTLISGFLWIGYLWLLFKRAPGIVRGAAMIEETNYKIEDWKNGG